MFLVHALSVPVYHYSLLLNVCDFIASEIFTLRQRDERGRLRGSLLLCILQVCAPPSQAASHNM